MKKVKVYKFKDGYSETPFFANINGVSRKITSENLNDPKILEFVLSRKYFEKMIEEVSEETEKIEEEAPETDANTLTAQGDAETEKIEEEAPEVAQAEDLTDFPYYSKLAPAGFDTREKIEKASNEELTAIKGIAENAIEKIRKAL